MKIKYLLFLFTICFIANCKKEDDEEIIPIDPGSELEVLLSEPISFTVNPNDITPLAAQATIQTKEDTRISITLLGEKGFSKDFEQPSRNHEIPILGLRPGMENEIELTVTDNDGLSGKDTIRITTPALPSYFPEIEILTANLDLMEPGMNLSEVSFGSGGIFKSQPILFDHTGEIRWYILLDFAEDLVTPFERLRNGNFLFARAYQIYEYDMLGNQVNQWEIDNMTQHHDAIEKPNGNLIIPITDNSSDTWQDSFVELDRNSGNIVRQWDLSTLLDTDRYDLQFAEEDWIHCNSVVYDDRDESLVISGRNQGIIKVSKNNELLWILAPHKGWGVNENGVDTKDHLLTAVDEDNQAYPEAVQQGTQAQEGFDWTWGQHAAMILPNGNVFAFDNGFRRNFQPTGSSGYSRGVEYEIDEQEKTVKQVWEYGSVRGLELFSDIISDVDYLPLTGNRLISPGFIIRSDAKRGKMIEVSYPSGQVVFEANINYKNENSTGGGWGNADLMYRAERLPLYY